MPTPCPESIKERFEKKYFPLLKGFLFLLCRQCYIVFSHSHSFCLCKYSHNESVDEAKEKIKERQSEEPTRSTRPDRSGESRDASDRSQQTMHDPILPFRTTFSYALSVMSPTALSLLPTGGTSESSLEPVSVLHSHRRKPHL